MKEIPKDKLAKIKKLFKWADSKKKSGDEVDQQQAETAILQAQKLLAEYNLSMSDVDLSDDQKEKVASEILQEDLTPKNEGEWLIYLYHVIARYNFCRCINRDVSSYEYDPEGYKEAEKGLAKLENGSDEWYKARYYFRNKYFKKNWDFKSRKGIRLIGEPTNMEIVRYIVDQLKNRVRGFGKEAYKVYINAGGEEKKNAFLRGYYSGFVQGIGTKLSRQKESMEKKEELMASMALVKTNEIQKWVDENITLGAGSKRGGNYKADDGNTMGYIKGLKTDIRQGLNKNDLNQKLLS